MHISELDLRDFRSWPQLSVALRPGVNLFVGRNGYGKTNVIEAVGYLAHLGSHRVTGDAALVRAGQPDARVSATAINQGRQLTAHLLIKPRGANQAQINRTRLRTAREVLGVVRSVLFSPEDLELVRGEPAQRRKYLDAIIATRTPRLAGVKADYDKVLRQRTALLKSAGQALRRGYDSADGAAALSTLDAWDSQLAHLGAQVTRARMDIAALLEPHVAHAYGHLAPGPKTAHVRYAAGATDAAGAPGVADTAENPPVEVIEADLLARLGAARDREIERGQSLVGPHRDDLEVLLGEGPAKGFASHGETWSVALALRFAEFELLRTDGSDPVLILDDVFAELDQGRREKLVALAQRAEQVLITAAVDEDLPENLETVPITRFEVRLDGEGHSVLAPAEQDGGSQSDDAAGDNAGEAREGAEGGAE